MVPMNTTMARCDLHNLPVYTDGKPHRGACATCYKPAGECDFGACRRRATIIVGAETPDTHKVRDARPSCARHAAEIGASYRHIGFVDTYSQPMEV